MTGSPLVLGARFARSFFLLVALGVALGACAPAPPATKSGSGGQGSSSGGATGSGGATSSSGGASASGGSAASGGTSGSGGATTGSGGGSGGSSSTGGATGSGGTSGSGGATSSGGGGSAGSSGGGASGSGGAAGAASASSCQGIPASPAAGGASHPFPQHRFSASCVYPSTCNDADMVAGWKAYKMRLIVDDGDGAKRVQRPENQNDSVSEGLGYGMLLAVYMNEKDTFDALWKYVQKHLDSTGLMNWRIDSNGQTAGANSATDGDEDMAFALVQADKQWGGYTATAKAFIGLIAKNDFEADGTVKGGDKYSAVNPSYLAPSYYRTFAKYTGDMVWMTILEKSYTLLAAATNGTTGLVPDWSSGGRGPDYYYDAARTPFRIALDACQNGEPRAVKFAEGVTKFFAGIGVKNIKDGYNISSGTVLDGSVSTNATFIGPAAVAAMAAKQASFVNDAYVFVAGNDNEGTESYYNLSWALLTTLVMTGNFVDLTVP